MLDTVSPSKATDPSIAILPAAPLQRLRVLLVTDSSNPSGVGEHMVTLAAALQEQAEVMLLFADTPEARYWAERASASQLDARVISAQALENGGKEYIAALNAFSPDVVHVHAGIGWEGHGLTAAAHNLAVSAIIRTEHLPYTLRALKSTELEAAYASGVASVHRIICVCEAARQTFRMSGIDPERYTVVHNGIAPKPALRSRAAVRAELGIGNDRLVLTVARFTEQKRHRTLLNALPALLTSCPDVRLGWVGSGPLEADLQATAAELGLVDRILFLGRRNDVPDLLAAADLFCLPSFFEGHPLVVLEAMAAGLPVVATRSLGTTEAVRNGETGLIVPVDNAPALAAAVARILNDASLSAKFSTTGREAAHTRFSAARMADATMNVYQDTLETSRLQGRDIA
ncbi:glycosyltransferase involved in cell wall biosynthesis [Paucimonas lemoignei]|uniref:Glycosyltransferase involved in cell wall biosynthesis n=1 Tax=Paucimonas lemoignei TaxID=29443 RepID=A0A4R3HWK6_PAULE|nr:glycosyltransferase family 4 protein [Paucimonas lemoignei]TCS35769.1 glycosyltransferase involved in cell wall biosynthesis [Paucimonas lemoignei]